MSFRASKTNKKKLSKTRGGGASVPKVQLTSLVDIMTILLVFLLKSFSAEGEIVTTSSGLTLPASTAQKKPELALKISISNNDVMLEGLKIVNIEEMMKTDDILIPELEAVLSERRRQTELIAKNSTNVTFKGDVMIEADKKIPYKILQKIMYTCGQTGYSNFSLLVLKKEG
ncbi:MAG: biopolymer transporter ExbD [Fibrobacteres bacterium]|nr:biopolymer transporter ExbD [Fibrobacterota bacterium]